MESFHKKTGPLFQQKYLLQKQSDILKRTRDSFLPRLISGKLSVENLDIQFPPGLSAFAKASADRSGQPGGNIG
jgi:type I restriction enzyme S subunit